MRQPGRIDGQKTNQRQALAGKPAGAFVLGRRMDLQTAFNLAVGLLGILGGFILRAAWEGIRDLQKADTALTEKVHAIETIVAGQYVSKDEFMRLADALFAKLDRIETKVDGKADK